jgi:hypothetical protein
MAEPIYNQLKNKLASDIATLHAADRKPDFKISSEEIEAALVANWRAQQPDDTNLTRLQSYVSKAVAIRDEVEAAVDPKSTANDPRAQLMRKQVALAIGYGTRAGTGIVPEAGLLAAILKQTAREDGAPMTDAQAQQIGQEVSEGIKYALWMERQLSGAVQGIKTTLESNQVDLRLARGTLAGDERRAAADRRSAQEAKPVSVDEMLKQFPAAQRNDPAFRKQLEAVMGEPDAATREAQMRILRAAEGRADAKMRADAPAQTDAWQKAMNAQRAAMMKQFDDSIKGLPAEQQAALRTQMERDLAKMAEAQRGAAPAIQEQIARGISGARQSQSTAPATKPPEGLTPDQQREIIGMRETLANYSLEPNVSPTAKGVAKAIQTAQR